VTVTYGARSPWRFSRAADLGAARPRCVPVRDARGMFHRTTLVTNDRVLTRGGATVHINAGPRHVTSAAPVRLTNVAPQAFPQRAILPHQGATMSARPWIRAAAGGGTGVGNGVGRPGALVDPSSGRAAGRTPAFGRTAPRIAPPSPYASYATPHVYNPPRPVAPSAHANNAPTFASSAPHIYNPPTANGGGTHIYNPAPANGGAHIYNPPTASNPPRVYNAPTVNPAPAYGAPHPFGAPPARVYNPAPPPPRSFPSAPAMNPPRTFAPPAQHAPAPPAHQTFSAPAMPPSRGFSPPASSWSGHPAVGGAHRR
jgi:hypothetical protein